MAKRQLPSPEVLRQLLRYEPETGRLFWRKRPPKFFVGGRPSPEIVATKWNTRHAGKEALTANNSSGYLHGSVRNRTLRAHRVIWAIVHGEWPDEVDHINGVRNDNRLTNLRSVTRADNGRNLCRRRDSTSGVTGVYWDKRWRKWRAEIKVDYRPLYLGHFHKRESAIAARKDAERKYGFHPNHGRPK